MISLQPFTPADFERLIGWTTSEELMLQYAGRNFSFPLTVHQLEIYLQDENRYAFKVIDKTNNKVVGHCEYLLLGNTSKIGRVLIGDEADRGKSFGGQIIRQLLQLSFKHPEITMAELNVYDWNLAAIKCYERIGFSINPNKQFEPVVNGKTWTVMNMVISKKDFLK